MKRNTHIVTESAIVLAVAVLGACSSGNRTDVETGTVVSGPARIQDHDRDRTLGAGDRLIVPFDSEVRVDGASADDFALPVPTDSFGDSAVVEAGPGANEVTIVLGDRAHLTVRGDYGSPIGTRPASGVDVRPGAGDHIVSTGGRRARPSTPVDVVPTLDPGPHLAIGVASALAAGDLDRDGDLDLVVGRANAGDTIWINDGTGSYRDSGQTLGGDETFALVIGDLDGDGDLDLVRAGDGGNQAWINDGAANLQQRGSTFGAGDARAVALADLDGDGDLDLIEGNGRGKPDRIWSTSIVTTTSTWCVAVPAERRRRSGRTTARER